MDVCEKCGGTIKPTGGEGATGRQPFRKSGECSKCGTLYRLGSQGWILPPDPDDET
jgi:uncharacterized protein with PIN domain